MKANKKMLELLRQIQVLAIQTPNIIMYFQSNISLLSIYSFGKNGKYLYNKSVYIDGTDEEAVIKKLEEITEDLKEMKGEN